MMNKILFLLLFISLIIIKPVISVDTTNILIQPNGWESLDFTMYYESGTYHVYPIRNNHGKSWTDAGNNSDCLPHYTSTDLQTWNLVKYDSLCRSGGTVNWDAQHVWAPQVLNNGTNYLMYYTGVTNWTGTVVADNNQSIGLATSTDLNTWTKIPTNNCGTSGDGCIFKCNTTWSWYSQGGAGAWDGSCRDPFIFVENGIYYMFLTTNGYVEWDFIIAIANSTDGVTFNDYYPINVTRSFGHAFGTPESPQLWKQDGRYYLYFTGTADVWMTSTDNLSNQTGWTTPIKAISGTPFNFANEFLNQTTAKGYNLYGAVYPDTVTDSNNLIFKKFIISGDTITLSNILEPTVSSSTLDSLSRIALKTLVGLLSLSLLVLGVGFIVKKFKDSNLESSDVKEIITMFVIIIICIVFINILAEQVNNVIG